MCTVSFNHVKGSLSQIAIAMLYRTGYNKAHYRHLQIVFTHSTLDKCFYLIQRANWRNENCDSILPFALPNEVMFKTDDSAHLSYRFEYLILLN